MNALLIVIDSLDYTRAQNSSVDLLPNIRRRSQNGLVCENMFSQAPFTEAATLSLYCGQNVLDNHGYYEKYNFSKETIFEAFKHAGYETFFSDFQPECFPSSVRRGVDNLYYSRGFNNSVLWNYRFDYYQEKYLKGQFNDFDIKQIIRLLDDNFTEWKLFLNSLINKDISTSFIRKYNKSFNASEILDKVIAQENFYHLDKKKYIFDILEKKDNHPLFTIPVYKIDNYDFIYDNEELIRLYDYKLASVCKKIRINNFISNFFFNFDCFINFIKAFCSRYVLRKIETGFSRNFLVRNALFLENIKSKYGEKCHSFKGQPSFDSHNNLFLNWIDNRSSSDPFFACMHIDDIHYPEMFFSYDSDDIDCLNQELDLINKYLKERSFRSKGSITTDLSILYADLKCECLFRELEKRGILDNTCVFITSDHGFSFSGYPIRNKAVNTFYLENFKIPFFCFGNNISKKTVNDLHSSIDIPSTICDIMNIHIPENFVGNSLISDFASSHDIITIEFCESGCPDIGSRKLMIGAFDKDYMVVTLCSLSDAFSEDCIVGIYNLKIDPMQKKDLKDIIDVDKITPYLDVVRKRIKEIKASNELILKNFFN